MKYFEVETKSGLLLKPEPGPRPGPWTQTLKKLDPEKPGLSETWNKHGTGKYV